MASVLQPGEPTYEEARRLWNGMIDRRPASIVRCETAEDVAEAVGRARDERLPLAVRGGGHGVAGLAVVDGGLVVDLSPMTDVHVDSDARRVRAGGGCRLGDVDAATQKQALAVPLGVVSRTGIAGLTLNGGIGWLRRKHGMSCDNLVSAEVVTADGRVLTASADENPDLLWGLRGGGGNFGVVTTLEYSAHPVGPEVMFVFVFYRGEAAADVLRAVDEHARASGDDFSPLAFLGRVPPVEMFEERWHGEPFIAVAGMHAGTAEEGERELQPMRDLGEPIVDLSGRMPYVEAQTLLDEDYPDGGHYYWKSIELDALTDDVIARLERHAAAAPSGHSTIDLWYHGGAMDRVDPDETPLRERAPYLVGVEANWEDPKEDDANVAWVRECIADFQPLSRGGTYLNFPGFFEEGEDLVRRAYGNESYERLVALKNAYDPANLFRLNGNIKPTT